MPDMGKADERDVSLETSSSQNSVSSAFQEMHPGGGLSSSRPSSPLPTEDDRSDAPIVADDENYFSENDEISEADILKAESPLQALSKVVPSGQSSKKPVDPELMLQFYHRLFPFKDLFQWLNHFPSPTTAFTNREIAFSLPSGAYIRYNAFATHDAMKKEVLRLNPSRFEIGPVYSANPRDRKIVRKGSFKPLEKELVFDIDMTDYDSVRTCCSKTDICNKCWNFITVAIKVLDVALRQDFGFQHILWVYSGRRGAHAWVCDERARKLDDSKRRAIAGYLEVVRGGAHSSKKVNLKRPLHPLLTRSLDILKGSFSSIILFDQNPWSTPKQAEDLLKLLPDTVLNQELRKKWESSSPTQSSASRWADIDELAQKGVSKSLDAKELMEAKQDVVFEYLYPRLDAEVSKHLNHLLKSPFCIHPQTGRVCVPICDPETFDPMEVPTVAQLIEEIDRWDTAHDSSERLSDYEKTSLKPYVEFFHRFVSNLMKEEMTEKRKREQEEGGSLEY